MSSRNRQPPPQPDTQPASLGLRDVQLPARRAAVGTHFTPSITLLGATGFLGAISWQVIVPVLPVHLSKIGYSAAQIGILVSLLSLAMGTMEMQVGHVVGRIGRRATLVTGLFANAVCTLWLALARSPMAVGWALAAVGASRGAFWPPLHATVAHSASGGGRGRVFGLFWFWTSVAFLTGPLIGGLVAGSLRNRAAFYLGAVFSMLAVPMALAITCGETAAEKPATGSAGSVLRDPAFFRLCLVNHLYYSMVGIWTTFLPLYMVQQGLSVVVVGTVLTVQGLTYAAVQIPAGRLADQVGPEWLIVPGVVLRALIALLVPLLRLTTSGAFLAACAVYGLAGGMIPVTFTALIAARVPRDKYTTAMGVYNSSGDLGVFVGPLLGGIAAILGIGAPFLLALPIGIASTVLALRGVAASHDPEPAVGQR
jgi:MFS transporter, DHA1 family, solute carrier family 18 (vesicular amine transporter), member 1/2